MPTTTRTPILVMFAAALIALTLGVGGCNKSGTQDTSTQTAPPATDQSADQSQGSADTANLAPVSDSQAAPSIDQQQNYSDNDADSGDSSYGQPVLQATDPPPPLPEYSQPDCPGDGYLWTPGYWSYAQQGYYWGPGAWAQPPQVGFLWTPGYWGYTAGRYRYNYGYWGSHIGFCSVLDGYSRSIVHWDLRESMTEAEIEVILQ